MNNSSLNWTLSSMINQDESSSEILQDNTAAGFCNEVRPTAQQFAGLKDEANIDAFRKYLKVCFNCNMNCVIWNCACMNEMKFPTFHNNEFGKSERSKSAIQIAQRVNIVSH